MNSEDLQLGMFVSVTDEYRSIMPVAITWGKGQGRVIEFEKMDPAVWSDDPEIDIPKIEWADGIKSTMHPKHLQPSTKKKYFIAALS